MSDHHVAALRRDGYCLIRGGLDAGQVAGLRAALDAIYAQPAPALDQAYALSHHDPDWTRWHRVQLFELHPLCQLMLAHPPVLAAIEPLLGPDCHVIANIGWRTPSPYRGTPRWHTDGHPHVPRDAGIAWDDRIPYPIFAIGCMMYLTDVPLESGPTEVVPGSHRSGRPAPPTDPARPPEWEGRGPVALTCAAGDIALFASDLWHRGLPNTGGPAREVFQVHYGRRDIAPRYRPFARHRVPDEVVLRATERGRRLIGVHPPSFYG
jgi:ectoine hydroxylase-related dioxygenase (phytanoyl-CoA dioxygenase family)